MTTSHVWINLLPIKSNFNKKLQVFYMQNSINYMLILTDSKNYKYKIFN